jgi:hypothetical protein
MRAPRGRRAPRRRRLAGAQLPVVLGGLGRGVAGQVDVVVAGLEVGAQRHHHHHRGHAEGDHDRGEHQRLRQRVDVARGGGGDHRRLADRQAAGGEQEQVGGVGEQRQADHHREGARAQHHVDAGRGHHADGAGDEEFHQPCSLPEAARGSTSIAPVLMV